MVNEAGWRLGMFLGVLIVMSLWESLAPRRRQTVRRAKRSLNNLSLVLLNTLAVRLVPVLSAASAATWAQDQGLGLLSRVEAPVWLETLVVIFVLDLLIYAQHVVTHHVPLLWQLHKVHHADLDLDATSGLRFHPIEIALSMGVKSIAAILLGATAEAIVLFEIVLNVTAIFSHSNLRLPIGFDRWLRWLIVTPDMHRVHHSILMEETKSNYGFSCPWWDRLFGTYRAQPKADHESIELGLAERRREEETVPLVVMLTMPFQSAPSQAPPFQAPKSDDGPSNPIGKCPQGPK